MSEKIICNIYRNSNDNTNRYTLGKSGNNPIICIGINPSTATNLKLDNTLKAVQRLSVKHGFDGWVMINLYPQRATNPNNMHIEIDENIHEENMNCIYNLASKLAGKHSHLTVWAAWGGNIQTRKYLKQCLIDISERLNNFKCQWITIEDKEYKNPHHPLYLPQNSIVQDFNVKDYINTL